jgi:hypothetical protein
MVRSLAALSLGCLLLLASPSDVRASDGERAALESGGWPAWTYGDPAKMDGDDVRLQTVFLATRAAVPDTPPRIFYAARSPAPMTWAWAMLALFVIGSLFMARVRMPDRVSLLVAAGAVAGTATALLLFVDSGYLSSHFTIANEGNTGRTLRLLYGLFHPEPVRSALVDLTRWLSSSRDLPPIAAVARVSLAAAGAGCVAIVALGRFLGGGWALSIVAAAGLALSPALATFALSDNPLPVAILWTVGAWTAMRTLLDRDSDVRARRWALVAFLGFQGLLAEMRPEMLLLWVVADAVLLAGMLTRRHPVDVADSAVASVAAWARSAVSTPPRMAATVLGIVLLVALPALLVRLPFMLVQEPRVATYFPFFISTGLWLGFVPGYALLAEWASPAMLIIGAIGLAGALLNPARTMGVGIGVALVLAGHWHQSRSHTDWEFLRWTAALLPILLVLGLETVSRWRTGWKVTLAAFAASLTMVTATGMISDGGLPQGSWIPRNLLDRMDNVREARKVAHAIKDSPNVCVVAPVLAAEHIGSTRVTPDRARVNILVLQRKLALEVPLGIRQDDPSLPDVVNRLMAACPSSLLYLGLDCTLDGVTFCARLREDWAPWDVETLDGTQYTSPRHYGLRHDPRVAGFHRDRK